LSDQAASGCSEAAGTPVQLLGTCDIIGRQWCRCVSEAGNKALWQPGCSKAAGTPVQLLGTCGARQQGQRCRQHSRGSDAGSFQKQKNEQERESDRRKFQPPGVGRQHARPCSCWAPADSDDIAGSTAGRQLLCRQA
jgi:hypothetical protein